MIIRDREFVNGTHIMAIINLTPDSFNEKSRFNANTVLARVQQVIDEGAEVIDLGAQSTRPGHTVVSAEEEIERLKVPLQLIRSHFNIPISIDTYYPKVAEFALESGADLINDIWGLQYGDKQMASIIAKYNASVCIMHNQEGTFYKDYYEDIKNFLKNSLRLAINAGIDINKIILDGGIGFGKTLEQNWELLNHYDTLKDLGYPLLLGTSRKSMFGGNVEDRLEPTLNSTRLATKNGILFVRVHDIKENFEVIKKEYENINRN